MSEGSVRGSVRTLAQACDGAPVILLADSEVDDSFLVASCEAGASGIVDGKARGRGGGGAVEAAAAGHRIVDLDRFVTAVEVTARAREVKRDREERTDQLTERERDVMRCLARAMSNADIAARLSISPRTVDKHVQHILQKLGVKSRLGRRDPGLEDGRSYERGDARNRVVRASRLRRCGSPIGRPSVVSRGPRMRPTGEASAAKGRDVDVSTQSRAADVPTRTREEGERAVSLFSKFLVILTLFGLMATRHWREQPALRRNADRHPERDSNLTVSGKVAGLGNET